MKQFFFSVILAVSLFCFFSESRGQTSADAEPFTGPRIAKSSRGLEHLPADLGQFWMTYDIAEYAQRSPGITHPQNSILNWILFDTGEEFWNREPFAVLSATKEKIFVYHDQQVQQYVSNVLDRFLDHSRRGEQYTVRIITVSSPDWKSRVGDSLVPYPVASRDIQGWLIAKERFPGIFAELAGRADFIELNAARNTIANAETYGWVFAAPVRNYVRDIRAAPSAAAGYVADPGTVDEGYRFEVTPLLSTNGDQVEILFRCETTVVDKMHSVSIKIPTASAPRQQLAIELPQVVDCKRTAKVSFPRDHIFLLDAGMVPMVSPASPQSPGFLQSVTRVFTPTSYYHNVLVFVENVTPPIVSPTPTAQ